MPKNTMPKNSMSSSEAKKRIAELVSLISKANQAYYENDSPTISDAEYDKCFR